MYSGFYQHEVEANLVDAVKMFEAMGYTRKDNVTLMLNGNICADQVANVSRDAMAAYVECNVRFRKLSIFLLYNKYLKKTRK